MERTENSVFISYRRTNFPWAMAIFQHLRAQGFDVFLDFLGISSGDFEQVILGNIRARAHFLVLLTPSALERCDEPGDWLRREIETAIESKRNIVPIMLESFDFNSPSIAQHLTGKLELLRRYNGIEIPMRYFDHAMRDLQDRFLNIQLSTVLHPVSEATASATDTQKEAAGTAPQVQPTELTAQEWNERGISLTDPGEKDRCFSEAIRIDPKLVEAFMRRGSMRGEMGDLDAAIRDFDEVIRLQPGYSPAHYNRGVARQFMGNFDAAIVDYNEAIRINPSYFEALANRGVSRELKGDRNGAMTDFNAAIRAKPDDARGFLYRADSERDAGNFADAIRDYDEAIRLRPDDAEAFCDRGVAKSESGDFDAAIIDYNEAIRLKPDFFNALNNRGNAHSKKRNFQSALRDYNEAIRVKPDFVLALNNRGLALRAMGDEAGAVADFEAAKRAGTQDRAGRNHSL